MDGAEDRLAGGCQALEDHDHVLRHVRVEAGGRLVAEEQRRVGEDLAREGQQLGLAAGDALHPPGYPDQRVRAPAVGQYIGTDRMLYTRDHATKSINPFLSGTCGTNMLNALAWRARARR